MLTLLRGLLSTALQVVDARSKGRFDGTEPEPRPGISSGHAPGALNVPFASLLVSVDGIGGAETYTRLASPQVLSERFSASGVSADRAAIYSCGTGVTACTLALATEVLRSAGQGPLPPSWSVYDGSWSEYAALPGSVIERSVE